MAQIEFIVEKVSGGNKYRVENKRNILVLRLHKFDKVFTSFSVEISWDDKGIRIRGDEDAMDNIKNLLIRRDTPGEIAWSILQYEYKTLDRLEEKVEKLQNASIHEYSQETLHTILKIKKFLFLIHRDYIRLRNTVEVMIDEGIENREMRNVLRDLNELIYDVEYLVDGTTVSIELMQNTLTSRMNQIMKILTVIATIMMPLTLITGIYGMNFRNMPEIYWNFGYYYSLLLMLFIALLMIYYFKKKKLI